MSVCAYTWYFVFWREVAVCFFFQAEGGIRGIGVTGFQTCALPIWRGRHGWYRGVLLRREQSRHRATRGGRPGDVAPAEIGRASCRDKANITLLLVISKKQVL